MLGYGIRFRPVFNTGIPAGIAFVNCTKHQKSTLKKKTMQQPNSFNYAFSTVGKEKKLNTERKPQTRKKLFNYIDMKYSDRERNSQKEEMDKDKVF